ncbi:50S ribosomal protein L18 [Candidatus Woesearchaeota archaeon]|jgi:large subunit ribosomal protein L18|nr:50S ribosomal protein L18 [Candidatus Woesearchaeota archaeon]|tara:strand:+ start:2738 stop:3226 length:489 start_codon:yes stop_codon:yes gene_type:complete
MKKTRLSYSRKIKGKTNYKKRLELLKSRKNRLVIRRTNKYIIIQIVSYESDGDKILASVNSKELKKLGWKNSCKNISASYLTGLLLGKKAEDKKLKEAILDLGLQTHIKGSSLYSALKGVVDSGFKVPVSKKVFPPTDRIEGKHISEKISKEFEGLKNKILK